MAMWDYREQTPEAVLMDLGMVESRSAASLIDAEAGGSRGEAWGSVLKAYAVGGLCWRTAMNGPLRPFQT